MAYRFCSFKGFYYCTSYKKLIKIYDCCENWRRKKREYDLSKERFNKVQKDVEVLKIYLKNLE